MVRVLLVVQCVYVQLYVRWYSFSARSSLAIVVETIVMNLDMSQMMVCDWKRR